QSVHALLNGISRPRVELKSLRHETVLLLLASGNENTATAQLATIQVMDGVVRGIKGIHRCMQLHFSLRCQGHQLCQVIVGSNQVADKVDLGRDNIDGGHIELLVIVNNIV